MHSVLDSVIAAIGSVVASWGYLGVVLLMAIESANIPLPSEAILPFAGFLVSQGKLNYHGAALAGAIGCVLGSIPSYLLGLYGGRPFLEKYGKWILVSHKDLETAERWVARWGDAVFFVGRMLPVVRTFISFPAGVLKLNLPRFLAFTFIGSWIWSYFLVHVGVVFGQNLEMFKGLWHKFDLAIVVLVLAGMGYYVYRHIKHAQQP
jgi:membrane protein DedA with SNARE-associated domain